MNTKCVYLTEGACEQQLINALKAEPAQLIPGKVKVFNIIQEKLSKSQLVTFSPGSIVVFVFDTDVEITEYLKKNVQLVKKYCSRVKLVTLAQVLNLEDELKRCTDVKRAQDITKSKSVRDFKSDFCRMKVIECRNALERHKLDTAKLWTMKPQGAFGFIVQNGEVVKAVQGK